ncbi:MAG: SgcJ/EcaC family oxidoreductase [Acidobacteriota bacterium]
MSETAKDESAIRDLIIAWHRAGQAGDNERVLTFMAADAIFLTPGRPPIRGRQEFAAMQRSMDGRVRFESTVAIQEVLVHGGWAHAWSDLSVTMFPADGNPPVRRVGPTLSIFRKEPDGSWVLVRDANMLAPEK